MALEAQGKFKPPSELFTPHLYVIHVSSSACFRAPSALHHRIRASELTKVYFLSQEARSTRCSSPAKSMRPVALPKPSSSLNSVKGKQCFCLQPFPSNLLEIKKALKSNQIRNIFMKITRGTSSGLSGPTDSKMLMRYEYASTPKNIIEPQ